MNVNRRRMGGVCGLEKENGRGGGGALIVCTSSRSSKYLVVVVVLVVSSGVEWRFLRCRRIMSRIAVVRNAWLTG